MDADFIEKLLSQGESVSVECKKAADSCPKSIWETYSAFANTDGGYILLGITEHRGTRTLQERFEITGMTQPDKIQTEFWNGINSDKVSANLLLATDVQVVDYRQKKVLVIHVPPADYRQRPVYINGNPMKGTYKRNHEGDYHCRESEIKAMFRDAEDTGNDVGLLEGYTLADLDKETVRSYRIEFEHVNPDHVWNGLEDEPFLRNMGALGLDRRTGRVWLTTAGLLMFGQGLPIRERFSNIRMDFLDTTNLIPGARWTHRLTYDGSWENNLYQFMRRILPWLLENLKRPFRLEGVVRREDSLVHQAVREALTNMVIHADYMVRGLLKVEVAEHSLMFSNPGLLKLAKQDIYEGGHAYARNPMLQTMLRMIGLGENIGSGVPTILRAWKLAGWPEPELSEDNRIECVNLLLEMPERGREAGHPGRKKLQDNPTAEKILELLAANEAMTIKEIAEETNLTISGATRAAKTLIAENMVDRKRDKGTYYYVLRGTCHD